MNEPKFKPGDVLQHKQEAGYMFLILSIVGPSYRYFVIYGKSDNNYYDVCPDCLYYFPIDYIDEYCRKIA